MNSFPKQFKKLNVFLFLLFSLFANIYSAQSQNITDTITSSTLNEVTVLAYKFPVEKKRIAQQIAVIKDSILIKASLNTADVLNNSAVAFIQKSQLGGGSPVLRGFEASRILLMIDGFRMNNAIYRTGHLQNIITTDNLIMDRIEVQYGPSSTQYGSDALGGVIHLYTQQPKFSTTRNFSISSKTAAQYASAAQAWKLHESVQVFNKNWSFLTGLTHSKFGDLRMGKHIVDSLEIQWLRKTYVKRINNMDSTIVNANPLVQVGSGYNQTDFIEKISFKPNDRILHQLNVQYSTSSDVPRYDRLTETTNNKLDYALWNYGPQKRFLAGYSFANKLTNSYFDEIEAAINYQQVRESRITRRNGSNNQDSRWEKVQIFGADVDLKKSTKKYTIQYGIEAYTNFIQSTAERLNIKTGATSKIKTRYADGPTQMTIAGIYSQYFRNLNKHWVLNAGLRMNYSNLQASFIDTGLTHFPFNKASQKYFTPSGNLGIVYNYKQQIAKFLISSGMRAPNVDDLSKVFESVQGTLIVPNPNLKAERTYQADLGYEFNKPHTKIEASVYYIFVNNALVLDATQYNGKDSLWFENTYSKVYTLTNKANAFIWGCNFKFTQKIIEALNLEGQVAYTYGRFKDTQNTTVPLDHIPPVFGKIGLNFNEKKYFIRFTAQFNGAKKLKDYNPNGEDNLIYATKNGMPAWYTCNLYTGYILTKNVSVHASLENILDKRYRYFASGISAPGRNLQLQVQVLLP